MEKVTIEIADIPVSCTFAKTDYLSILAPFQTMRTPLAEATVPAEHIQRVSPFYADNTSYAYMEMTEIASFVGEALLPFDRMIFHSVAFVWRNRAYLLTGPSGIGKTTQYALWKKLCGEDVCLINGDKPALYIAQNQITVYPTPWQGKENMGQMRTAVLGGIILLEQSCEDKACLLSHKEAAMRVFQQCMITAESAQTVKKAAYMTENLLRRTPVWLFQNRGDEQGTAFFRDVLEKAEKEIGAGNV